MTLSLKGAIKVIRDIWDRKYSAEVCTYRRGNVTIDAGAVERGVTSCPHCGATIGMGMLRVLHRDGRAVSFLVGFLHDVEVGHPIAGVDVDALVAIVEDE